MQQTPSVLMIRPVAFRYNPQTSADNFFQCRASSIQEWEVHPAALAEFDELVRRLRLEGIEVEEVEDTLTPETPDSLFPNNWVSFHDDGTVIFYPMMAENRRIERRIDIIENLIEKGFVVSRFIDLSSFEHTGKYLEGTGSLVLDRKNRVAYAALSGRTHPEVLKLWSASLDYEVISFNAFQIAGSDRVPVYHTNVLLSIGTGYALVGADCIDDPNEREKVLDSLEKTGHQPIYLSEHQVEQFAGNVLELERAGDLPILVMSTCARNALNGRQISEIESRAKIVDVPLPTIERYGGGSARCMLAEIFLSHHSAPEERSLSIYDFY
ncbi:MAG: amidinotransferase [Crocinitomicaceae bacterium]|nr:amidinotransferase [Crocinitomicaceae bacterium]